MSKIYVIGGANIDIFANSVDKIIPEDSNIANISFSYGGVGRNIAENLTNLGEKVFFVSAFSNDDYGKGLVEDCKKKNFDLSYSKFVDDIPSSIYLAIMDNNHDMYVACNDMRIAEYIDTTLIDNLIHVINDDDYVIVDTNLKEEIITYIFDHLKGKKIMDAISVNKVYKLEKVINKIDLLKLNKLEAEAVFEKPINDYRDVVELCKKLNINGTREVIVSTKKGMYVGYNNETYYFEHDQYGKDIVNATGAGDALLSAYVYGDYHHISIESKSCLGLANANLCLHSKDAVAKINIHDVSKRLNEMKIKGGKIKVSV